MVRVDGDTEAELDAMKANGETLDDGVDPLADPACEELYYRQCVPVPCRFAALLLGERDGMHSISQACPGGCLRDR